MNRFLCSLVCALMPLSLLAVDEAENRRPNILIIYMDDLGWKDVGVVGSEFYQTPNIDRLAADGVRFSHAYSPAPVCAPSRGAFVSGKFPGRTRYTSIASDAPDESLYSQSKALGVGNQNLEAQHLQTLPRSEKLFAEHFRGAGYATCFIGKWHIGRQPGYHPLDRGYDEVYAVRRKGGYPYYLTAEQIEDLQNVPGAKVGDYLPEKMTAWANEFMARKVAARQPFLVHLSHFLVHSPITANFEFIEETAERLKTIRTDQQNVAYATMVRAMDASVGSLIAQMEALGQLENTLIIFTSDNGGFTTKGVTSNFPLLGGKSFSFEGGYRVPLIAHWRGKIAPGRVNSKRVVGMDIYPTLLEAFGLPLHPAQHVDGLSLWGELTKGAEGTLLPERALYFHHPHYTHASSPHSIIIDGDYKLIRYYNDASGAYALFNLRDDPAELNDLADTDPERVNKLAAKLADFLAESKSLLPIPVDSHAGQQALKEHADGTLKGWSRQFSQRRDIIDKATERRLALEERADQMQKLRRE